MTWSDSFGRSARKLRVSITDRCNLRCTYCMPARPIWMPRAELLSYEELLRLVAVAVQNGVRRVRVTGGEPLVRSGAAHFIAMLKTVAGLEEVAMTTNGVLLKKHAASLKAAGLDRVTVSLDSLDPDTFRRLARRDGLSETLAGIEAAEAAGLPVKINIVVMRGVNDGELEELARWGRESGRRLRFIEFMPLEGDRIWSRERLVAAEEIVRRISARYPLQEASRRPSATAVDYQYSDGVGGIGVIASVTRAFCADCDRVRLTADGSFRTCLFAEEGLDLRRPLRSGASDLELAALMAGAVAVKQAGHLIGLPEFRRPERPMHAIGG